MKLIRDEQKLLGSYYYQKIGQRIDLRGTIDQASNVLLEEFDRDKPTGIFKGLWTVDDLNTRPGDGSESGVENSARHARYRGGRRRR